MTPGLRALLWPAVATSVMFALLVGLGFWQLRRLGEKEALIARIETRASAPLQDLPPRGQWPELRAEDYDFTHARARGRFLALGDALIFAPPPVGPNREPGYLVLTPFALADGGVILVDRGFLPNSKATDAALRAPPLGETTIVGLMRAPQSRNAFTPADAPARRLFYTRDPTAIARALGLTEAAPFALALEAPIGSGEGPRPLPGAPDIVNNHLSYAFTWFGLALGLVVVFALYARGAFRRAASEGP